MKTSLICNLLIFDGLASAHLIPKSIDLLQKRDVNWDLGHSGNYQFAGCGAKVGGSLTQVLNALYAALIPVIEDAKNSATTPSPAYNIFFKDPANAAFVAQVLTDVTTGVAKRSPNPPMSKGNPTFLCIRRGKTFTMQMPDGSVADAAKQCADPNASIATYLNPTPFIVLCEHFFTGKAGPQTPTGTQADCPVVNREINRFTRKPNDYFTTGSSISQIQMWGLLEEIVHYYLYAEPTIKSLMPEAYNMNKAWALNPTDSLENAISYAFYAATVHSKCTDWPQPRTSADGREVLEVNAESEDPLDVSSRAFVDAIDVAIMQVNVNGTLEASNFSG